MKLLNNEHSTFLAEFCSGIQDVRDRKEVFSNDDSLLLSAVLISICQERKYVIISLHRSEPEFGEDEEYLSIGLYIEPNGDVLVVQFCDDRTRIVRNSYDTQIYNPMYDVPLLEDDLQEDVFYFASHALPEIVEAAGSGAQIRLVKDGE
ncbi:hypothetical protein Q31b_37730 [Novipirellula aureliae]|uniref:Uncharacterized protein n=1 Tax=Novipirellula aureliae TaxID=2527966 RepID=A0A5C6DR52_9BACT|nr:hypothetical protein [Novipirellula aureliae]TWU38695.1 hypothetical protein Q31b_37730 [Novipirellula aureliae]